MTALQIASAFSSSLRQGMTTEIWGAEEFLSMAVTLLAEGFRCKGCGGFDDLLDEREMSDSVAAEERAIAGVVADILVDFV
jgi:hypothetical protein